MTVEVSIGVAPLPGPTSIYALLTVADTEMYRTKRSARLADTDR